MTPWEEFKNRMKEQNKGGGSSDEGAGSSGKSRSGTRTPWQDYKQRMEGRKKEADFFAAMERDREPVKLQKLSYPKPLSAPSGEGYFSYPGEQIQKDRAQLSDLYQADNDRFLSGVKGTVAPYYIGAMEEHRASQPLYQSKGYPGLTAKPEPVTDLEAHIEPTEDYYAAAVEYAKNVHPYAERAGKTAQAAAEYEESVGELNDEWQSRLRSPEEIRAEINALGDDSQIVGPTRRMQLENELGTALHFAYEDSYKEGAFDLLGLSKTVGEGSARIRELEKAIQDDQYTLDNWPGQLDGRSPTKDMLDAQRVVWKRIERNKLELAQLKKETDPKNEEYQYYLGRIFADEQNDPEAEKLIAQGKEKYDAAWDGYESYLENMDGYKTTLAMTSEGELSRALAPYRKEARSHYPLAVMTESLSEEDQKTFYYLIGRGLEDLALQFADESSYKDRMEQQEKIRQWAGSNLGTGLLATAGSLLMLPTAWSDPLLAEGSMSATGLSSTGVGFGGIRDNLRTGVSDAMNQWGTISEKVPVLGGKGLGDLYQLGMSMADSYLGGMAMGPGVSAFLGGSAFASGYNQAIDKGASKETALLQGVAQGVSETLFEYLSLDKLFNGDVSGGFIKSLLQQGGIEASEEMCTSIANHFTDRMIMGEKSEYEIAKKEYMEQGKTSEEASRLAKRDFIESLVADALGGFISGGGMSAANSAVNKIMTSQQNQINRAHELLGKVDERTDAYTISRALHTVGVTMTEDNRLATIEELIDRGMGREDAQQISTAMEKSVNGKRLTSGEKKLLQQDSHLREMLRTNLQRESAVGENPVANSVPTAEKSAKLAQPSLPDTAPKATTAKITGVDETNSPELSEDAGARVGKVTQAAFEPTADGKTHLAEGGEAVTIRGVAKVETGKERNQVYLEVVDEDGHKSVVPGDSLDYGSRDEMLLYEGFGQLGISAKYFPEFLAGFRHQQEMGKDTGTDMSIAEYALYFEEAVFYGRHNMEGALARSALLQDARNTAYAAGQDSRSQIKKQSNQQEAAVATAKKSGQGKVHKKGQVYYPDNMPLKLSKFQKAGVKVAEKLASFGLEVHVYRSTLNAQGQWINDRGEASPNGYYVLEDGSIHVDLNAGAGGRGLVVYTLSHEITHFMARHNPEGFETLADLLVKWYEGKGVNVEDLIRDRMEEHGYSREVAFEEVVAHSCESFLTDSDILIKLTELKQKHSKIYNQIRETVVKFVEWMRRLFRDIDPDSQEGRMLHEARGTIDHIYEAFTSGMSGAIDTYQWVGAQKNLTDEGEIVKYSFRNSRSGTANDGLQPYSKELKEIIESQGNVIVDSYDKLVAVVNRVFDKPQEKATAYFGTLDYDTLSIIEKHIQNLPQELRGNLFKKNRQYSIAATFDGIRHLVDEKKLTRDDVIDYLDRLADTIIEHDSAYFSYYTDSYGKKNNGILFKKQFSDGVLQSFDIVSHKKKRIALVTLYLERGAYEKKKSAKTLPMQNATAHTPKARVGQTSTVSISHKEANSNTQSEEKSTNVSSKRSMGTLQETLMAMEPALVENRGEQKLLERYQTDSKKRSAEVQRQQKMEAELSQLEASEIPNESKIKALKERLIRSYNLTEALDQRMIAAEGKLKSLAEGKGRLGKTPNADLLTMSPEALRDRVAQVEQQLAASYGRQDELTQQRDHAKAQSQRSTVTRVDRKGLFSFVRDLMRKNGAESLANDRVKAKTDELGVIFDKAAEVYDQLGSDAADTYLLLSVESFTRDLTDSGTVVTDTVALDIMAEAKRLMEGSRMQTVMDRVTARYEELLQQKDQRLEEQRRQARENEEKIVTKYQEARAKSVDSRKKTAVKNKIRKSLKELDSLLGHGNKKNNVKKGMQDVAASLLAYGDVLFSHESQIDPETMVRNGITTDLTDAESDALNKYADLLQKRDDYEKRIAAVRQYRRGDWVTKEKDLQEMVDFVNGKLAKATKDLSSVFERERARMNKVTFSAILSELTASYKALENAQDEYIRGAYISYVYDRLVAIKDQGTPVKDMSLAQLTELHDAVKMVMTTIKNANRLFREGKAETLSQMVDRVQTEIRALYRAEADPGVIAGKVKQFVRSFVWNELKPYYAFDRIGSEGLMELFWDVIKAEGNYGLEISEAGVFVENLRKEHGYKDWDMDTVSVFHTDNGMDFKVTLGDMMSIYAYSRRDQAFKHMTSGGFVFNPGQEYKDGEKKLFGKRMRSTEIETYRMTEDLLLEIINTLTPEQRAYAEAMQDYLTRLGEKGNEVSRQMYGIDLFKEKFYFPLKSSADFRSSAEQQLGATPTTASLVNTGMTKETVPNASNPIVLERFDDVAIRHIDQMLKYHNYVLPIENMRKVMDYTQLTDGEWDTSVKRLIKAVYGQEANAYLEQWITDLNGGASESGAQNPLAQFFARSKKVSVAGNLSVVVQQYFAVTRAAAEIDPKYFVPLKGSDASKSEQRQWDELKQWAGLAVIKEMGGFDMGSARTAQDYLGKTETKTNLKEKADNAMMWGASKMDEIGWSSIWRAVKKEVADKQGLQPGTEEFFKAAGQRFTEVIVKTQVYDSVTARSGFMRSKRDSVKYLVSFLGEPTTIVNMMFSAQVQLYRAQRSGDVAALKKARGRIGRTSAVLIFSSVLGSLAKSLVYAMRDDEETEAFLERYWKQFGMALRSDMNPLGMIPIGRDLISMLDGWDIERPDVALLNDVFVALKRAIKGDKPVENWGNFTLTVFNLCGVPVKNVVRDGKAFVRLYGDITDDIKPEESGASFYRGLAGKDRSKDEILYEALVNGNAGKVQQIRRGYADNGKYTTALRKALRTCDPRIREAALARYEGDITGYMNIAKEILAEGHFVQDDIVSAIMTEVSNIKTEREGKAPSQPSTPAMYTGEDYMASVLDEPETAEAVREYIIDRYKSKGKSQAEAESAFYSDIRSEIKGEYDMGTVDYGTAFDYLTDFGGYSENDAYWALDKWDYSQENGGTAGYSKYNDFFSAVETGEGLADMIDLYESKGVEAKDMASQITSHFKPIYIAMSAAERRELKKTLVKAYSALGYDRSDAIDKWLKN